MDWLQILGAYLGIGCAISLMYLAVWVRTKPVYQDDFWVCAAFIFVWPIALIGSVVVFCQVNLKGFWSIFRRRSRTAEIKRNALTNLIHTWMLHRDDLNEIMGEEDSYEIQSRELAETILEQDTKVINRWVGVVENAPESHEN